MLEFREHFNGVAAGDRLWVFHGRNELSTHMRSAESWAPGEPTWRREQDAPIGTSANVLAAVGDCFYSFGGEFIASNVTGTVINSQVFHVPSRTWRLLESAVSRMPLNAAGAPASTGRTESPSSRTGSPRSWRPTARARLGSTR